MPKFGRGLIVSPPVTIQGAKIQIRQNSLDSQELRFALLFWDRLAWPILRHLWLLGGQDEQFLESVGVLRRPEYTIIGEASEAWVRASVRAFHDFDQREPGAWALAQGPDSLLLKDRVIEAGRGALVELHRAIPVPDKDVPLNDILEFRQKRRDELVRLRQEIDAFYSSTNNSADTHFELRRSIEKIDAACADLLKLAKEWRFAYRLSDLRASFELRPVEAVIYGLGGWGLGTPHEMPLAAAAIGVAGSFIKIGKDFGLRSTRIRSSPYRYVYHFHNEVF